MKRILSVIALCVMTFWGSHTLSARGFGLVGGANFTSISNVSSKMTAGYHAGLTYKISLPLGFAIQPSLLYNNKVSELAGSTSMDVNIGYLELPVSFQWGPDLLLFRPFIDVAPFVGYGLTNDIYSQTFGQGNDTGTWIREDAWSDINRLEYGLGLGVGLEIWKFQLLCRYNWNMGPLAKVGSDEKYFRNKLNDNNFSGVTLSLALLF